jgi:predicted membrane chloride channel (bestrophin family)
VDGIFRRCCGPMNWSKFKRKPTEPLILYTVIYNSADHWSILTQRLGSAWPDVLPFCIFNIILTLLLRAADPTGEKYFLAIQGHKFIQFIVSFLFVTRVTTALGRFNEARGHLEQLYEQSREFEYPS